jgi:hypothetical protein
MSIKKNGVEEKKELIIPTPAPKPIAGAPPAFATEITPDMAVEWLEKNSMNRKIRQSDVDNWADVMKRKQWELNGETIIISDIGDILDGQHRLSACFLSNTVFQSYVVIGMTKEVFTTIDTGKKRSGADALHIHNKMMGVEGKYEAAIMAAVVTCLEYKTGVWKARHSHTITNTDKIEFLEKNPGISEWIRKVRAKKKDWVNRHAASIGGIAFLGSKKYPMKAETFVAGFVTGNDLPDDSSIRELRRRLGTETKLKKWDRLKLIIYAWNLHVDNIGKHTLRMPAEVPVIAGTEPPVRLKKEPIIKKRITVSPKGNQTVRHMVKGS